MNGGWGHKPSGHTSKLTSDKSLTLLQFVSGRPAGNPCDYQSQGGLEIFCPLHPDNGVTEKNTRQSSTGRNRALFTKGRDSTRSCTTVGISSPWPKALSPGASTGQSACAHPSAGAHPSRAQFKDPVPSPQRIDIESS